MISLNVPLPYNFHFKGPSAYNQYEFYTITHHTRCRKIIIIFTVSCESFPWYTQFNLKSFTILLSTSQKPHVPAMTDLPNRGKYASIPLPSPTAILDSSLRWPFPGLYTFRVHTGLALYWYIEGPPAPRILNCLYTGPYLVWTPSQLKNRGALVRPNNITKYSQWPMGVLNAVFHSSPSHIRTR